MAFASLQMPHLAYILNILESVFVIVSKNLKSGSSDERAQRRSIVFHLSDYRENPCKNNSQNR